MYAVEVYDMGIKLGALNLLYDINFKARIGENWAIFGKNGCGKTTLLAAISGYFNSFDGLIRVFDQRFDETSILKLRKQIALVSTSFFERYYRWELVREIILAAKYGSFGINRITSRKEYYAVQYILKKLDLLQKSDTPYLYLSKGEKQKVLLARALYMEAQLYLFDEPYSGLDQNFKNLTRNIIRDLCRDRDKTVICVTHDIREVENLFERGLIISNKTCFYQGLLDEKDFFKWKKLV